MADWKADARRKAKESKEGKRYELVDGKENTFRLLPAKEAFENGKYKHPEAPPYVITKTHYNVGPDKASCRCGKNEDNEEECWLCDEKLPELQKSASKQKRMQAGETISKSQLTCQVSPVDKEAGGKFGAPKPWTTGIGGAKAASTFILSLFGSTLRSYEDPVKGYNVTVERIGTKLKTTYGPVTPDEKPTVVPASVLSQIKSLDELVFAYDEEDQKAAYYGRPRKGDENDENEDKEESEETSEVEDAEDEEIPEEPEEGTEEPEEEVEESEEEIEEEAEEESEYEEEEPEPEPVRPAKKAPPAKVTKPEPVKKLAPAPAKKVAPMVKRAK